MKVLVLYFTQSGQQEKIVRTLTKAFTDAGDSVHFERIEPVESYPFPWSAFTLFNAFIRRRFGIIKSMSEVADSIRNDDTIAIHSACWLFSIAKKLNKDAALNNMNAIIKRINGGYTGIERRMQYYELCKALIKDN